VICNSYVDDTATFSDDFPSHLSHVHLFLTEIRKSGTVLWISGIASHFAPQIQANAMQQHFRIALIAMQNNAQSIALSSANLPLTFRSDRRLDYCG